MTKRAEEIEEPYYVSGKLFVHLCIYILLQKGFVANYWNIRLGTNCIGPCILGNSISLLFHEE